MKKKLTIAFLLSLSCLCLSTAVACKGGDSSGNSSDSSLESSVDVSVDTSSDSSLDDSSDVGSNSSLDDSSEVGSEVSSEVSSENSSDSQPSIHYYTVTLRGGEGYTFIADDLEESGDDYTITLEENSVFSFTLDLGAFYTGTPTVSVDGVALAEKNGQYTFTVSKNATVNVSGVLKDVSAMMGSGSFDDAFVVSRPIDLVYIAEQVNKGNTAYSQGYYVLANDIDCKGEELQVIGDMNNENAYFSGCFSCYTEGNTMERFTISNFTINAEETGYAGLFGFVQTDMSIVSSGLFYGIRIDNFTINVNATAFPVGERSVYCGGLIGYGVGVKSYLCDATNGEINVYSDSNEFAFVGGLIGIAQGAYNVSYNHIALSEVAYATVDVDVNVLNGSALASGGIAGYTLTNSLIAPSVIHNSYATGNVSGAIRAGGLVGVMGQYSSVASSYASGDVVANARNTADSDGMNPDYCIAYAGGLVGYAENDSVVNDSFSTGILTAVAVDGISAQKIGRNTAGMDLAGKVSVNSQKHEVINCPENIDMNALLQTLVHDLGWQTVNWNIQNKVLPTINYEASSEETTTTITVHFVTQGQDGTSVVKVNTLETETCSYINSYAPFVDALNNGMLPQYAKSDDGTMLSYGFYFDEACTRPVPYSYVTTRNVDLYMGFTDPTPVIGTYHVSVDGKTSPVTIILNEDREAVVYDGASSTTTTYYFDGTFLTIEGARLARFFDGAVQSDQSVNEDESFDLNRYMLYYFQAELVEKDGITALALYDGVYFTKDAPLYAYAPNTVLQAGEYYIAEGVNVTTFTFYPNQTGVAEGGSFGYAEFTYTVADNTVTLTLEDGSTQTVAVSDLTAYDIFKGEWRKSASVNEFFAFDGMGNWSSFTRIYTRTSANEPIVTSKANEQNGTYVLSPDGTQIALSFNGNPYKVVKFDAEGMMKILNVSAPYYETTYSKTDAQLGLWESYNGTALQLHGFDKGGLGKADLHFEFSYNGYDYTMDYALTYELSETANYYCLFMDSSAFGYFYYEEYSNLLIATLLNPIGDGTYQTYVFSLNHEIDGDWINQTLADITFNGLGAYNQNGDWTGTLTIGDDEVAYTLEKGTLSGSLNYNGQQYTIAYNPTENTLTLTYNLTGETFLLQRKDALAGIDFVDKYDTNVSVTFDGKSRLANGGTMTVNGVAYTYAYVSDGIYTVMQNSMEVGALVYQENTASYALTLATETYELYVRNEYMGDWAISNAFDIFTIYPTDLNGAIPANFKGQNVLLSFTDATTLSFACVIDHMPMTYYMFLIRDENSEFKTFALSEYESVVYGNYTICERVDDLFGKWVRNDDNNMSMTFDGVNNDYVNGVVRLTYKIGSLPENSTAYYYKTYADGEIFIWSQNAIGEKTYYYKLVPCAVTDAGAYVKGDKAYKRIAVDALYKTEATETATGYTFLFNGMNTDDEHLGEIVATKNGSETITYSYDVVSYNANQTATLTLINKATGETYTATLYYSNPEDITITLVKADA